MREPKSTGLPPAQGLYRPEFEHDSCGVGFVAHIKGKRSHQILIDAEEEGEDRNQKDASTQPEHGTEHRGAQRDDAELDCLRPVHEIDAPFRCR